MPTTEMSQRRSAKTSLPPPPPEAGPLPCPRCDSNYTKFCYYNNYNLSQPRHFCKSCRRYWTRGGTLRDVPVGGGSRKNSAKRSRTTATATATADTPPFRQLNGEQYQHHPHVFGGGSTFTSLLSGGGTIDHGLFGLEDLGFGLKGRGNTLWPFGADTWHVGSVNSDCGFAADYLPELSIASTPGDFMK